MPRLPPRDILRSAWIKFVSKLQTNAIGFFLQLARANRLFQESPSKWTDNELQRMSRRILCPAGTNGILIDEMPSRILLRPRYILWHSFGTQPGDKPGSLFKEIADDCLEVEFASI